MKILVTGSAGFIGFHLTKALLKRGDTVVGLDNINDYYDVDLKFARLENCGVRTDKIDYAVPVQSELHPEYSFIKLNLEDKEQIDKLFKKGDLDIVCNLAAQAGVRYSLENPMAYVQSNLVGFSNILEGCRNNSVKNFVYASSSSVYGLNEQQPFSTRHHVDHPVSLYAATKKSNELMAHSYSHLFNIPTTGLRFFTVYGPWGRPDMAYFSFTKSILEGKPIKVFNNGNMSRDFTYINDIVDGILRVLDNPAKSNENWNAKEVDPSSSSAPYRIYNIGNNSPVNLLDFIETLEKQLNKKAIKEFMPIQPGDVYSTWADVTDLMEELSYKPRTNIEQGVTEFVNWFKGYYS